MTRKPRRVRLDVQALEGRALLSMVGPAPPRSGSVEVAARAKPALTKLNANLSGRFALGPSQVTLMVQPASTVKNLSGTVKGSGILLLDGGSISGGTLQFGNKKGLVTLNLVGTVPLPTSAKAKLTLTFAITGGTGAFANLGGTVVAKLTITARSVTTGTFTGTVKPL
jgi:hypothetical protein